MMIFDCDIGSVSGGYVSLQPLSFSHNRHIQLLLLKKGPLTSFFQSFEPHVTLTSHDDNWSTSKTTTTTTCPEENYEMRLKASKGTMCRFFKMSNYCFQGWKWKYGYRTQSNKWIKSRLGCFLSAVREPLIPVVTDSWTQTKALVTL